MLKKHVFYYAALILFCVLAIVLVKLFGFSQQEQFFVVVFLGFFYVIWGVLHHILHHSLRLRIMIEYIVIATVGIAVTFFVLKGIL